ncbi:BRO family protein [Rhodococcus ruber]|uniref:phage antirepressor n=1 Tax=Rhodococcus ruber TaxID=1830 RepID=UPI0022B36AD2|nr:BRO family protein [Rhodococcus ruber]MCZ4505904.1 BRO family protein [Rhodococcus ruber]
MSAIDHTGAIVPFQYEGANVRIVTIDGEPWFVASDVARILEYRMASDMTRRLDEADRGYAKVRTPSGEQDMTIISESGLYDAVFRSNSDGAKPFRRWVTSDVMPTIRKTGSYSTIPTLSLEQQMAVGLEAARQIIAAKDEHIAQLEPKAEFYDELMDADGTYPMIATAHILGWGRNVMMAQLRRLGILQANNLPYRRYDHHFKVTPGTYTNRRTGETVPTATTSVRPSGLDFLRKKLAKVDEPVQLEFVGTDA